jgi:hypothetical protein
VSQQISSVPPTSLLAVTSGLLHRAAKISKSHIHLHPDPSPGRFASNPSMRAAGRCARASQSDTPRTRQAGSGPRGAFDAVSQSSSSMHYAPIGSLDDDNLSVTQHRLLLRVFYQASMAAFWASRNWSIAVAFVTSTVLYITV